MTGWEWGRNPASSRPSRALSTQLTPPQWHRGLCHCIMTLRLLTKILGSLILTAERIAGPGLSVLWQILLRNWEAVFWENHPKITTKCIKKKARERSFLFLFFVSWVGWENLFSTSTYFQEMKWYFYLLNTPPDLTWLMIKLNYFVKWQNYSVCNGTIIMLNKYNIRNSGGRSM